VRGVLAVLSGIAWSFAGCGAHGSSAQRDSAATASSTVPPAAPCDPAAADSRWREMTWAEYYMDVEERAWRRGGRVIWIEPPRVKRERRELAACR
jgi:hypothetical protein